MIPNIDQLLIVCGIALAFVILVVWIMMKIPSEQDNNQDKW